MKPEEEATTKSSSNTEPLWLFYPIWGTLLTVGLSCLAENYKLYDIGSGVFYLGFFGLLPSAVIILSNSEQHFLIRLLLLVIYAVVSAIVIFILGWMAACWFCQSCH
jgi:hypothetical protein